MREDRYANFVDLAQNERENVDYRITVVPRPSTITIVAPHAGAIEARTGSIARAIAGSEFNLYLFEGIKQYGNSTLHLTSHRFDEPRCLALTGASSVVVAIHGCAGADERILVGGLDGTLKARITKALRDSGLYADLDGHRFEGSMPQNICNRSRSGQGVQLEISRALRGAANESKLVGAVRGVLLAIQRVA